MIRRPLQSALSGWRLLTLVALTALLSIPAARSARAQQDDSAATARQQEGDKAKADEGEKANPAKDGEQQETPPDAAKKDAAKKDAAKADAAKNAAKTKADDDQPGAAAEPGSAFQETLEQWKQVLRDLRTLQVKYQEADEEESAALRKEWDATIARGDALIPKLRETGMKVFKQAPNQDRELTRFLMRLLADDVENDRYEPANELAQLLIDNDPERPEVYNLAALAAVGVNDFERGKKLLDEAYDRKVTTDQTNNYRFIIDEYLEAWKKEQQIRAAEADDNLPRVSLKTNRGEIVLELFENEAPDTVGNFISLVEAGFYDGLTFHRVLPQFMAQGGCPKGDGTGDPGYSIYCEHFNDKARKHFRGSISMANAGRDTGGSQFFLTFVPTPNLNGKHTVFGRIVEGLDVLEKLQRRNPESENPPAPDVIESATVIRKDPNKTYKPNKVPG